MSVCPNRRSNSFRPLAPKIRIVLILFHTFSVACEIVNAAISLHFPSKIVLDSKETARSEFAPARRAMHPTRAGGLGAAAVKGRLCAPVISRRVPKSGRFLSELRSARFFQFLTVDPPRPIRVMLKFLGQSAAHLAGLNPLQPPVAQASKYRQPSATDGRRNYVLSESDPAPRRGQQRQLRQPTNASTRRPF